MMIRYRYKMGISPIVDGEYTMELPSNTDFNADFSAFDFGTAMASSHPLYGNDIVKEYSANEGFQFRATLNGNFRFVGKDFNAIKEMSTDDIMLVVIQISYDGGISWQNYHRGFFTKTDCEFDYDNNVVVTSLSTVDDYTNVLAGINKEYDLVRLAPAVQSVKFKKRAILQVYGAGEDVVTNIQSETTWETSVVAESDDEMLVGEYHFARNLGVRIVLITEQAGIPSAAAGVYIGTVTNEGTVENPSFVGTLEQIGGAYHIGYKAVRGVVSGYWQNASTLYYGVVIVANADSEILYAAESTIFNFVRGSSTILANVSISNFYSRVLTDSVNILGESTTSLSKSDIVEDSSYKRVLGYSGAGIAINVSTRYSDTPTEWGVDAEGMYVLPPSDDGVFYPIARSYWLKGSYWLQLTDEWAEVDSDAAQDYSLRHAYTLDAVLTALLKEVSPSVTFAPTAEYSQFLYGNVNMRPESWNLMISPKANLVNGEYQTPSQKAPITLQQVLEMLRNVYQLYWFIEDGKMRIEHIQWFRLGRSYDIADDVVVDLTQRINPRNGKSWDFGQNKIHYDKADMPERYEFSWMDDVSKAFEGSPIEILSPAVERGNIEKVVVDNFTSDIDYILMNPSAVSPDGFVLMATIENEVPIVEVEGATYRLQNGYASFSYSMRFWMYDLPSNNIEIEGYPYRPAQVKKTAKQTVVFPAATDIDPLQLVRTSIGDGQIERVSIGLVNRRAEIDLMYEG